VKVTARDVETLRSFNRAYTRELGLLNDRFLQSPYSLAEVRVLYELAHGSGSTASDLRLTLDIDFGYLSRVLAALERAQLIKRSTSRQDRRKSEVALTKKGRAEFAKLEFRQRDEIRDLLARLGGSQRHRLLTTLEAAARALDEGKPDTRNIVVRHHRVGDMGWIVHRQALLYQQEYGWNEGYEALIAGIVSRFLEKYDALRERCWVAEVHDEIVGSVFCVKRTGTTAQLRLLYVEPHARGLGIGTRLVDECIAFARARGYSRMMLWTNSVLANARRVYERAGWTLVKEEPHMSFGKRLHSQVWELSLKEGRR
jgi:DNA-binding MarR family transcriptional regulator/GNAT superfamily N-acetyltransferase